MEPATFQFSDHFEVTRDGIYPNREAGVEQVIDRVGRNTMVGEFEVAGRDLLIDEDHNSLDPQKSSIALGWVTKLYNSGDRLMAQARWTGAGTAALSAGNFRFCSPVFNRAEQLGGNRVRPIELHSIGLTNEPVMRKSEPIANRLILNRSGALTFQGERITNRRAAELFSVLVREEQLASKCSFTDSWNTIRNRFSFLNALMRMPNGSQGVILNRAVGPVQTATGAEQKKYWSIVEKAADAVRERIAKPVVLYQHGNESGSEAFWQIWDEASAAVGGDRRRAFDWIRDHQPEVFGNFVLNSPEANQFFGGTF